MVSMKYDLSLLDRNTKFSLWHVMMQVILTHVALEEALLGSKKMSSS